MSKIIIIHDIISDPVMMMQTLLREVEKGAIEKNLDPSPIKQRILNASTVENISEILDEVFDGEIKIIDKLQRKIHG